ncbi:MAG: pyridoxamine 5'-phosphate oxidase family protein [Mucilaginibacter sp.]
MLGTLNEQEIIALLSKQITGYLACSLQGESYLVPVNYVYKNNAIYAHSGPGKKIDIMRQNPKVCFTIAEIESIFRWKSVICQGAFEEIINPEEKQQAMQLLTHHIMPYVQSPEGHASHGIGPEKEIGSTIDLILYKIVINEKSGRFEHD